VSLLATIAKERSTMNADERSATNAGERSRSAGEPAWGELPGRLVVVSGPSGSGKTTLVRRALEHPGVRARLSISATTRAPRPGEEHGREYFFLSSEEFQDRRGEGGFLECAQVHGGWYGTPASWVAEQLEAGACVILEIDVQGGMQVKARVPSTLLVFVHAGDLVALEARLRGRGTEDEATIQRRLKNAREELEMIGHYDRIIVNDDLDRATEELARLLGSRGCGDDATAT
jgi:guanylate kinase